MSCSSQVLLLSPSELTCQPHTFLSSSLHHTYTESLNCILAHSWQGIGQATDGIVVYSYLHKWAAGYREAYLGKDRESQTTSGTWGTSVDRSSVSSTGDAEAETGMILVRCQKAVGVLLTPSSEDPASHERATSRTSLHCSIKGAISSFSTRIAVPLAAPLNRLGQNFNHIQSPVQRTLA